MKRSISFFSMVMTVLFLMAQHELPSLPYSYSALEPYIDSATMHIHYNNHHGAYVRNLNASLDKYPELKSKPLAELFANMNEVPSDIRTSVRNNGGGHYNHVLFWELLTPASKSKITPYVEEELTAAFGSVERFKEGFEQAAMTRFGSGWAWLIRDESGRLRIISTPNQDNPLMSVLSVNGTPILALDVWEHAYYLHYQSRRAEYVKNFWNIVNWEKVEERLML
jgi:Fe-Mn family superoxide dismutase